MDTGIEVDITPKTVPVSSVLQCQCLDLKNYKLLDLQPIGGNLELHGQLIHASQFQFQLEIWTWGTFYSFSLFFKFFLYHGGLPHVLDPPSHWDGFKVTSWGLVADVDVPKIQACDFGHCHWLVNNNVYEISSSYADPSL